MQPFLLKQLRWGPLKPAAVVRTCVARSFTPAQAHAHHAQHATTDAAPRASSSPLGDAAVNAAVAVLNSKALHTAGQLAEAALCVGLVMGGDLVDVVDVVEVAVDVASDSNKKPNQALGQHQQASAPVTADDVRAAAKSAASVAAAVGLVAVGIAHNVLHPSPLPQHHQQQQPFHQNQQQQLHQYQQPHGSFPPPSHLPPTSPHHLVFPPPPPPLPPVVPFDVTAQGPPQWRTGLLDCCSGGAGMWFDAFFCGSCLYFKLQEKLGDQKSLSQACLTPCTWLNPFWMCGGHAQLRWRIAQRHSVPVRCIVSPIYSHTPHCCARLAATCSCCCPLFVAWSPNSRLQCQQADEPCSPMCVTIFCGTCAIIQEMQQVCARVRGGMQHELLQELAAPAVPFTTRCRSCLIVAADEPQ